SPERDAPRPNPDCYDIRVENGEVVNKPTNKWEKQLVLEKRGEPKIVEEAALGGAAVVAFSGKDAYVSPTPEEFLKTLRRATIAAKFRLDENAKGPNAVFGNTDTGGIELSCNATDKVLRLWVSVNGIYTVLETPIELGRYYQAFGTYDGQNAVLYLDGKEVARKTARGTLTHPVDKTAHAFVLGGDIYSGMRTEAHLNGRVEFAKLYSWALKPEQVANWSE
ncbi:MAG: LamG domain-containing protein, partial [Thermoguttaceae bacterium]|nr:LamG domain-containing protein [Thermoguttaceae bacterium]